MTETLGRFLSNVIEFVIAGVLFTAAVAINMHWFFEKASQDLVRTVASKAPNSDSILFVVAVAFAYAVGILAENTSRIVMEWRLDQIKERRRRAAGLDKTFGDMRFAIMARHPALYLEVESQLKRLRVERVVTVCQVLVLPVVFAAFFSAPSWPRLLLAVVLVGLCVISVFQVDERFKRYCRSIERGYLESREGEAAPAPAP